MVTEWFLDVVSTFIAWIVEHLPSPEPPAWLTDLSGYIDSLNSHITGLSAWLDFPLLRSVVAAWLLFLAAAFALKAFRIVASFLTAGGGSAG